MNFVRLGGLPYDAEHNTETLCDLSLIEQYEDAVCLSVDGYNKSVRSLVHRLKRDGELGYALPRNVQIVEKAPTVTPAAQDRAPAAQDTANDLLEGGELQSLGADSKLLCETGETDCKNLFATQWQASGPNRLHPSVLTRLQGDVLLLELSRNRSDANHLHGEPITYSRLLMVPVVFDSETKPSGESVKANGNPPRNPQSGFRYFAISWQGM